MRFEDERYIRCYTRDTTTILMLSWQSRAVMWETFRKLDRAGILDLGEDGLDALAATIRLPLEIVEAGMPELLRRGVFEMLPGGALVSPRFVEAQEAVISDKARARVAREKARDMARASVTLRDDTVTPRDANITPRDETVTPRHAASRAVTLCCASRAVPVEHSQASSPPPGEAPATKPKREPRGTRLPEDWQPTPELVARLRGDLRVDPMPAVRRFKNYWLNASRNASKPRWDLAFENWVEKDAAEGKLPAVESDIPIHRVEGRERFIPKPGEEPHLALFKAAE